MEMTAVASKINPFRVVRVADGVERASIALTVRAPEELQFQYSLPAPRWSGDDTLNCRVLEKIFSIFATERSRPVFLPRPGAWRE
jgi:hypothetical protein